MKRKMILAIFLVLSLATGATAATIQAHQDLFTDVPESHTHRGPIHWAAENGIIYGYQGAGGTFESGNTYGPDDPITRGQAASILYRYHRAFPDQVGGGDGGGAQGPQGPAGPQGPEGPAGADGTFECSEGFELTTLKVETKKGYFEVEACARPYQHDK